MMKTIPVLAALAATSLLIVPTVSRGAEPNSVRVSYADLNLASDAGASILSKRIVGAARVVCEIEDSRELPLAKATNACRNQAIAGAQPQYLAAVSAARHPTITVVPTAIEVIAG
jgi:UrcA family protein